MTEMKLRAEQLIKMSFKDIVVQQSDAIKTIAQFTRFPHLPAGLAYRDTNVHILYQCDNFIDAYKQALISGNHHTNGDRDGAVVRAGYILDLINLVKPEFKDQSLEMVHETTKIVDEEQFLKNNDVPEKQNNNYLAIIFGRAASILWINENYQQIKQEPFMDIMTPINFFDNYRKMLSSKENEEFIATYYLTWLGVLIEVGLLNKNTNFDELYNAVLQRKLPELIVIQKSQLGNNKFGEVIQ